MPELRYTLVSDGSSDRALMFVIKWLLYEHLPDCAIQSQWADVRGLRPRPVTLSERINSAMDLYPCDVLFVHRDAEREAPEQRVDEIQAAVNQSDWDHPTVPVVPVRMTEAWLLADEDAIRSAAGNPNGSASLAIPQLTFDAIHDPKRVLHEALRIASELPERRRRKLRVERMVHRVADQTSDFSPLRGLTAFRNLEQRLVELKQEGRIPPPVSQNPILPG